MDAEPKVSIIIVNYNTRKLLAECLESIYAQTRGVPFEIIVVDNHSSDDSVAMLKARFPDVRRVENAGNPGFGVANNQGFAISRAPYIMLLNSDALLLEDTGAALVRFLENHPRAGIVGPDVVLMDNTRQPKTRGMLPSVRVMANQNLLLSRLFPRSRFFAGLYVEAEWAREMRIGWVSGVCMVIRRQAYAQSGGFDPAIFMYAEDVDLCRRCADGGWETWRINAHAVRHLCGGSTRSDEHVLRNRLLQQRNFLRLLDASMGPAGRLVTRAGLAAGLMLRAGLRGPAALVGGPARRLIFRADLLCLADFFRLGANSGPNHHAHRA